MRADICQLNPAAPTPSMGRWWMSPRAFMSRASKRSAAALGAEFVRRGAGLLAEEAGEVRRVGEGQLLGDVVDRLRGEDQLALGFGQHALADQMAGGDAGRAFDVVVEPVDSHAELLRIKIELALGAEILV